jgi:ParB-like chromosome segregation protein Spo0J
MTRRIVGTPLKLGFEQRGQRIPLATIKPLRRVTDAVKLTPKYRQIASSIREIGIVEPPVVARDQAESGTFILLDGHLRLEVLKELGETEVTCLVSTDDEAFTYNKRVNRIAMIQEHRMIMKAIDSGASEERLAKTLSVNVDHIRRKRRLLDGICPEVAELLKDKHISIGAFWQLKKLAPMRQIEAAELMVAMNKYTLGYARSLVAATPQAQLAVPNRPKVFRGVTRDQFALMERESSNLEREFRIAEQSYGNDHLDLVLAKGYLAKLLSNARVTRYLVQHQSEIATEFRRIAEVEVTAA